MKSTGQLIRRYWFSGCAQCKLKPQRTTGKERRVSRWEHEALLEAMEDRVVRMRNCMRIRRSIAPNVPLLVKNYGTRYVNRVGRHVWDRPVGELVLDHRATNGDSGGAH
jgi:hypothetical protein